MTVYKNLAEFVSSEIKEFGGVKQVMITHKLPASNDPARERKYKAIVDDLSESAKKLIQNASTGERLCLHTGRDDKDYPIILDVTDAKDAGQPKGWVGKGGFKAKDETGVAVGGAWTNAINLYGKQDAMPSDQDLNQLADIAWRILQLKLAQEARVRADKAAKATAPTATATDTQSVTGTLTNEDTKTSTKDEVTTDNDLEDDLNKIPW